jgi:hypothetical protein
MRARTVFLIAGLVAAATPMCGPAYAFNPLGGIIGALTAPLRGLLPHGHHRPMPRHHEATNSETQAATQQQARARADMGDPEQLGRDGPPSWPTAYGDIIGYTLWPADYDNRVRAHGFSDIVAALTGRASNGTPVASDSGPRTAATTGSGDTGDSGTDAKSTCGEHTAISTDWPAETIKQTQTLTAEQRIALDKLQVVVLQASKQLDTTCSDPDVSPLKRLDAMKQRLWAIQSANALIRAPLQAFYDTLSDAQKASLNRRPEPPRADRRMPNAANTANAAPMGQQQYQACAAQASGDPERLMRQIQQTVRPTPEQRAAVEALGKTTGDMAKLLIAACAQSDGKDPPARLDAADNELTAINHAATTIELALNELYGKLNDEQKARFDALGR